MKFSVISGFSTVEFLKNISSKMAVFRSFNDRRITEEFSKQWVLKNLLVLFIKVTKKKKNTVEIPFFL